MRLAVDLSSLNDRPIRSFGRIMQDVMPVLSARGDVELLLISEEPITNCDIPGGKIIGRECYPKLPGPLRLLARPFWLARMMKRYKIDSFFQIDQDAGGKLPMAFSRNLLTIHDLYVFTQFQKTPFITKAVLYIWLFFAVRMADVVLTPSEVTMRHVERLLGGKRKLRVNPNGLARPLIPTKWRPVEGPYLACVCRQNHWKGTDYLLEMYGKHLREMGYSLVLGGVIDDKSGEYGIEERIKNTAGVVYLGAVSDQERTDIYAHAAAMVYLTRFDGFGIPPLEAALLGVPVVVNDIPIMREVTRGRANYVSIDTQPMEDVAAAIDRVAKDRDEGAIAGLKQVAQELTWEAYAERLLDAAEGSGH